MSLLEKASLVVTPNAVKAGKLYSVIPNTALGDMDVVRATTATRVNNLGLIENVGLNVPILDYSNGSCPSLLVEPQRTNLLTYSNDFSNSIWVKLNCTTTANSAISPDGNNNASKLTSTVSGNFLYNVITASNATYTFSCFVKYFDANTINISLTDFSTGSSFGVFNFNTKTFTSVVNGGSWTNTTTNVIALTNGWFKISITSTKNAGLSVSSRIDTFAVGTSVYIYGGQLELGSYPTSYIPTVASSITRNDDLISKSGISSLINSQAGTMFIEASALANNTAARFIELNDGTTSALTNNVYFRYEPTTNLVAFTVFVGGIIQCNISYSLPLTQIANNKMALVWSLNRFEIWVNGSKVVQDTLGITPAISTLSKIIFSDRAGANKFEGNLKSLQIYKTALTNTECIALTTL